jgi:hypothetical protein
MKGRRQVIGKDCPEVIDKNRQEVIDALLAKWPAGFRNKHLAEALGVSRARASQLLSPRLLSGELARTAAGRARYIRGPDCGRVPGGIARGAVPRGFWREVVEDYPKLAYVALSRLALTDLRTRQQVRTALRGLAYGQRFLVVGFEGVHSISQAASHELFINAAQRSGMFIEPINLEPGVARTVWRLARLGY